MMYFYFLIEWKRRKRNLLLWRVLLGLAGRWQTRRRKGSRCRCNSNNSPENYIIYPYNSINHTNKYNKSEITYNKPSKSEKDNNKKIKLLALSLPEIIIQKITKLAS